MTQQPGEQGEQIVVVGPDGRPIGVMPAPPGGIPGVPGGEDGEPDDEATLASRVEQPA
jgi:hypothetical protein